MVVLAGVEYCYLNCTNSFNFWSNFLLSDHFAMLMRGEIYSLLGDLMFDRSRFL